MPACFFTHVTWWQEQGKRLLGELLVPAFKPLGEGSYAVALT